MSPLTSADLAELFRFFKFINGIDPKISFVQTYAKFFHLTDEEMISYLTSPDWTAKSDRKSAGFLTTGNGSEPCYYIEKRFSKKNYQFFIKRFVETRAITDARTRLSDGRDVSCLTCMQYEEGTAENALNRDPDCTFPYDAPYLIRFIRTSDIPGFASALPVQQIPSGSDIPGFANALPVQQVPSGSDIPGFANALSVQQVPKGSDIPGFANALPVQQVPKGSDIPGFASALPVQQVPKGSAKSAESLIYSGYLPYDELLIITDIIRVIENLENPSSARLKVVGGLAIKCPVAEVNFFKSLGFDRELARKGPGAEKLSINAKALCDNIIDSIIFDSRFYGFEHHTIDYDILSYIICCEIGHYPAMKKYINHRLVAALIAEKKGVIRLATRFYSAMIIGRGSRDQLDPCNEILEVIIKAMESDTFHIKNHEQSMMKEFKGLVCCLLRFSESEKASCKFLVDDSGFERIFSSFLRRWLEERKAYDIVWFTKAFHWRMTNTARFEALVVEILSEYFSGESTHSYPLFLLEPIQHIFPNLLTNPVFLAICDKQIEVSERSEEMQAAINLSHSRGVGKTASIVSITELFVATAI